MENKEPYSGGVAVWYFIGATFLFAGATLFGDEAGPALRVVAIVLGAVVFVAGIVVFRKESSGRK